VITHQSARALLAPPAGLEPATNGDIPRNFPFFDACNDAYDLKQFKMK